MENKRIIRTNFYSNIANEILRSVIGQLSDGWGENNSANDKWWRFADVETDPDGRTIITISNEERLPSYEGNRHTPNGFYGMTDEEILKKFATWIKKTVQLELKYEKVNDGWRRGNTSFETSSLEYSEEINVAQAYYVYDTLLGRDCSQFSTEISTKVIGQKKSEEDTKREEERRAEHAANDEQHSEASKKLTEEYDRRRKEILAQLGALDTEIAAKRKEAYNKWFAEQTRINNKYSNNQAKE